MKYKSVDDTSITYDDRLCPRDREEAKARGQSCLRKCNSHKDCISSKRRCLCDGLCGWSCIRPGMCGQFVDLIHNQFFLEFLLNMFEIQFNFISLFFFFFWIPFFLSLPCLNHTKKNSYCCWYNSIRFKLWRITRRR